MDCRKFHRNLEDYLDDGLDFPGRFGMERHAQQCIGCGKIMSDAQRLRRMSRQMERVKAPANFESRVLEEIAKNRALGRFSGFRRFWIYGFEIPAARKLIFASSCFALLAMGALYLRPFLSNRMSPEPPAAPVAAAKEPAKIEPKEDQEPAITTAAVRLNSPSTAKVPKVKKAPEAPDPELEQMVDREVAETDYVEFRMVGPDNRPISVRWPGKSRTRYGQTDEEYFIRNVSH